MAKTLDDAMSLAAFDDADRAAVDCPLGWPEPFVDCRSLTGPGALQRRPVARDASGAASCLAGPPTST
jgi:hypothetical protein